MGKKSIVIARSNGVDPDSRVEKEANTLAKSGYDVIILAWDRTKNYKEKIESIKLADSKVVRISFGAKAEFGAGLKSLKSYLKFQYRLFWWLIKNRNKYDVAHLCDFDTAYIGSKAARICKKRIVFDIFDYLSTDAKTIIQKVIKKAEDRIIDRASATIICTEERKLQIKDANPRKLTVIHNTPAELPKGSSLRLENSNSIRVVYIGILQDYRLLKEMIRAIEKMESVELHIGGFGKHEDYVKKESETHDNIFFYGKMSYQDVLGLEEQCDIMTAIYDPTIGNHYFAAPNKFYEALFLGKPLIMVENTGMSNVVKKNDIGILINYSEESFVDGILRLMNKKGEWHVMGEKMKRIYEEKYSWNEMEKRLLALYEDL